MKIKLEPTVIDHMPREVATAMLAEPKARMSNTFRKTCKRARETVYSSATPLRTNRRNEESDRALYTTPVNPPSTRNRLQPRTIEQLRKWLRRSISRRYSIQEAYVKLEGTRTGLSPRAEKLRQHSLHVLAVQAGALEAARESVENELNRRGIAA